MPFNAAVPVGTLTIADNKPLFQANFTAIDTAFSANHTALASATNIGLHKQVSFIGVNPAAAVPVTTEGLTVIAEYLPDIAGSTRNKYVLFCRQDSAAHPASTSYQITGTKTPINSRNGCSNLPGGMMIQWGESLSVPALGLRTVTFNTDFDSDQVIVTITAIKEQHTSGSGLFIHYDTLDPHPLQVFADRFVIVSNAPDPHTCFWTAIGPRA